MPVIAYFFGIYIRMCQADHLPAHFMPLVRIAGADND
jgi:hypothetical protein